MPSNTLQRNKEAALYKAKLAKHRELENREQLGRVRNRNNSEDPDYSYSRSGPHPQRGRRDSRDYDDDRRYNDRGGRGGRRSRERRDDRNYWDPGDHNEGRRGFGGNYSTSSRYSGRDRRDHGSDNEYRVDNRRKRSPGRADAVADRDSYVPPGRRHRLSRSRSRSRSPYRHASQAAAKIERRISTDPEDIVMTSVEKTEEEEKPVEKEVPAGTGSKFRPASEASSRRSSESAEPKYVQVG